MKIINKSTEESLEIRGLLDKLNKIEDIESSLMLYSEENITLATIVNPETMKVKEQFIIFDIDELFTDSELNKDVVELGQLVRLIAVNINLGHVCDLCNVDSEVVFDCSVPTYGGSWGVVCPVCFKEHNCSLGNGKGQRLIDKNN